jgi:hypothetical protein
VGAKPPIAPGPVIVEQVVDRRRRADRDADRLPGIDPDASRGPAERGDANEGKRADRTEQEQERFNHVRNPARMCQHGAGCPYGEPL